MRISATLSIPDHEIEITFIRAQGAGGQNVNKVASAVHLRFDIRASSLPEIYKKRLLALSDSRITKQGVIVIKSQTSRSQEANRVEALERLATLIRSIMMTQKKRRPSKPSRASQKKRMDKKTQRGRVKRLRQKVGY